MRDDVFLLLTYFHVNMVVIEYDIVVSLSTEIVFVHDDVFLLLTYFHVNMVVIVHDTVVSSIY